MDVWALLLSAAALIALGWYAHAFFHKDDTKKLSDENDRQHSLFKELERQNAPLRLRAERAEKRVEELEKSYEQEIPKYSREQVYMLLSASNGQWKPPNWSDTKRKLMIGRILKNGWISSGGAGYYVNQKGLEVLDELGLVND